MRVATSTIYSLNTQNLNNLMIQQNKLQQQIATGTGILTPADNPVGAARVLGISQSQALTTQYSTNAASADTSLQLQSTTIDSAISLIGSMKTLALAAGGVANATDKQAMNTQLMGMYQELLGYANAQDGLGNYLFSGFKSGVKPFTEAGTGNVTYNGDQGQQQIQISTSRNLPTSIPGSSIFQNVKNGNGTFTTSAAAANTGTGLVGVGTVLDKNKWNSVSNDQNFNINFQTVPTSDPTAPPTVTYDIVDNRATLGDGSPNPNYNVSMIDGYNYSTTDNSTSPPTVTPNPRTGPYPRAYTGEIQLSAQSGDPAPVGTLPVPNWDFGGSITMTGVPKAGDSFNVAASTNQDLFATIGNLSSALTNFSVDSAGTGRTAFQNQLTSFISAMDNALTNLTTANANIGSWQQEARSQKSTNDSLTLTYTSQIKDIAGLDYAKAISDFSQNQTNLEAARSSYSKVVGLSLFQYIS